MHICSMRDSSLHRMAEPVYLRVVGVEIMLLQFGTHHHLTVTQLGSPAHSDAR